MDASHSPYYVTACVVESCQRNMFCLLLLMCFGQELEESAVEEVECVQPQLITNFVRFNGFALLPNLGRFVFSKRWRWFLVLNRNCGPVSTWDLRPPGNSQQATLWYTFASYDFKIPPGTLARFDEIRGRYKCEDEKKKKSFEFSYGGRKPTETKLVRLCAEFLDEGTDTITTTSQWIMVKLAKLGEEIEGVVGKEGEIREEDLEKMPYLKAVILEGLRRHPPGHFLLPHAVTEETTLGGYVIPKNAVINFTVVEIGVDQEVWEDAVEFKPERFLKEKGAEGVREIKMMLFGAGRRICTSLSLAVLLLEHLVANLVWEFQWRPKKDGEIIHLSKLEFTVRKQSQTRPNSRRAKDM
ncbi:hypothetical protein ACLOJK_026201 [Asimina triloba]